ncbi:PREDICTED: class I histocompatibility antigen, F10 alpha chain-like [Gekko japonicus]|uniref:Class I histocompatibility antigen, F10 alpha chain-like n=1 Tax=Gekko japonicus TaxID=146911 RepID=A0ABM1JM84_GEKJA|nr:PREDICTED: class I histocompatibility antigen, F10 alpha chain-like [Gekko japonicus]
MTFFRRCVLPLRCLPLRRRHLPLLGVVALLLMAVGCSGSSHSMRYFHTAVSEPGPGLPQFIAVGYVDDQPIDRYDSITKKDIPQVSWMEEFGNDNPKYWETETQKRQGWESISRVDLVTLRKRFKQQNSTGVHTLQLMYGCEVGPDGQLREGRFQYAYDGEDFLALDRGTVTWTARVPQALVTKSRWETETQDAEFQKSYLEGTCVEWLQRYLGYGSKTLLRTEAPVTRVARKKGYDGQETLFCQLYGFYPKDIEVTWMKDGEDRRAETMTGGVVPNSDGTYNTWLSIEVDPKEKGRYQCRVGHDSLPEPLDLAWEEPASNLLLIVEVVVGVVLAAILLVVGVTVYMRKRRAERGYKATPGSDQGSDNSTRVEVPDA